MKEGNTEQTQPESLPQPRGSSHSPAGLLPGEHDTAQFFWWQELAGLGRKRRVGRRACGDVVYTHTHTTQVFEHGRQSLALLPPTPPLPLNTSAWNTTSVHRHRSRWVTLKLLKNIQRKPLKKAQHCSPGPQSPSRSQAWGGPPTACSHPPCLTSAPTLDSAASHVQGLGGKTPPLHPGGPGSPPAAPHARI